MVTRAVIATLVAEAAAAAPEEACGLLLGRLRPDGALIERAAPAANVAADPRRRFEIDPAALILAHKAARQGGPALVGYYHAHPDGPPEPSAVDRAHAAGDGRVWAIVAAGTVRFWYDTPNRFEALSYRVADG